MRHGVWLGLTTPTGEVLHLTLGLGSSRASHPYPGGRFGLGFASCSKLLQFPFSQVCSLQ